MQEINTLAEDAQLDMLIFFLFIAHIQAVIIPIILGINSINKFKYLKNNSLIPFGFFFLGLASMFEMIDHTQTSWIYVNHSSFFNFLFYSFLSLGLGSLSISVIKDSLNIKINVLLCFFTIVFYLIFDKSISIFCQAIISFILIANWGRTFRDWLLILYPIFGIIFTTFFGANLSSTGDQFWHIFIGPSGTISVFTFYSILNRSDKKY